MAILAQQAQRAGRHPLSHGQQTPQVLAHCAAATSPQKLSRYWSARTQPVGGTLAHRHAAVPTSFSTAPWSGDNYERSYAWCTGRSGGPLARSYRGCRSGRIDGPGRYISPRPGIWGFQPGHRRTERCRDTTALATEITRRYMVAPSGRLESALVCRLWLWGVSSGPAASPYAGTRPGFLPTSHRSLLVQHPSKNGK